KVRGASFVDENKLDTRKFEEARDYLWAVPISEINLNPNLAPNNPGYGN
ncbi:protein containing RagB/SusD domain protein, partial [human gut metagenome]